MKNELALTTRRLSSLEETSVKTKEVELEKMREEKEKGEKKREEMMRDLAKLRRKNALLSEELEMSTRSMKSISMEKQEGLR